MCNTQEVEKLITELGIKKNSIAKRMGISVATLNNKINNVTEFTAREVMQICRILYVDSYERMMVLFFAEYVAVGCENEKNI